MSRYVFQPISDAPKDGRTLILGDDAGCRAAGHWAGDMWAQGHKDSGWPVEQVDFEPTKFALPKYARKLLTPQPNQEEEGR